MKTDHKALEHLLNTLSLGGNERDVYALCFLRGPLPALAISKELKINRAAVYQIINQLIEKGLLKKENVSGQKTLFNSISGTELQAMLTKKQEEIAAIQDQIPALLVDKKAQKNDDALSVETLSNSLSLKQMLYRAMDDTREKLYLIASVDSPYNIYEKKLFDVFLRELSKKKITLQVLVPKEENSQKNNVWNHPAIKVKFLEKSDYPFSDGLLVSDSFLFMFSWNPQNPKGLVISDKTIRQTYVSLFLLLWEKSIYSEQKNDSQEKKVFPADMQLIPGGYFYSGAQERAQKVFLDSFLMDKTPVTNQAYQLFVKETGYKAPQHWLENKFPKGHGNHPVFNVSWHDAKAYAEFVGKRLPSAEEWEKAARGTDKRIYPWGNHFEAQRANMVRTYKQTTPVEKYPLGKSYYGLYDMAGNVWEWTSSASGQADEYIIKGGSWSDNEKTAQCFYATPESAQATYDNIGFRCAKDII